jgi:hypothetical protein
VRGSLAHSICEISKNLDKDSTIKFIVPPVIQLIKDQATEVRVSLMQNMKHLAEVIGSSEVD